MSVPLIPADVFFWDGNSGYGYLADVNRFIFGGVLIDEFEPPTRIRVWSEKSDSEKEFYSMKEPGRESFKELCYICLEPDKDGEPEPAFEIHINYDDEDRKYNEYVENCEMNGSIP